MANVCFVMYLLWAKTQVRLFPDLAKIPGHRQMYMKWTVYILLWRANSRRGWNFLDKIWSTSPTPSNKWHRRALGRRKLPGMLRISIVFYTDIAYSFSIFISCFWSWMNKMHISFFSLLKIIIYSQKSLLVEQRCLIGKLIKRRFSTLFYSK